MSKLIGRPFHSYVRTQLTKRSEILRKDRSQEESLGDNFSLMTNAFIQLRSSVDVLKTENESTPEGEQASPPVYTSDLARLNKINGSRNTAPDIGLNVNDRYRSIYYNTDDRGFRGSPGITGVQIKTRNVAGSVREASINMVAWSKADLDDLDKLYFRPGYTILLEWGHNHYNDNRGNVTGGGVRTVPDKVFFNPSTFNEIEDTIESLRETSGGNYDALLGFVVNFSWSIRMDGGFDINIRVFSKGSIMSTLSMPKYYLKTEELENSGNVKISKKLTSPIHYLLEAIKEVYNAETIRQEIFEETTQNESYAYYKINEIKSKAYNPTLFEGLSNQLTFSLKQRLSSADGERLTYISLKTLFEFINVRMILKAQQEDNTKSPNYFAKYNTSFGNTYTTFDDHASLDPGSVIIPKYPISTEMFGVKLDPGRGSALDANIPPLHQIIATDVQGNQEDIMNIFVSDDLVLSVANGILEHTQESSRTISNFVTALLGEIDKHLGRVTDLNPVVDSKDIATIVDFKKFDIYNTEDNKLYEIPISGLNSFVEKKSSFFLQTIHQLIEPRGYRQMPCYPYLKSIY